MDEYSRTKSIAEQEIIKANGSKLQNQNALSTCALRSAGIYGEEEQRHFPRIVTLLVNGLFSFVVGEKTTLVEFVHVDNLVYAHLLAGEKFFSSPSTIAGKSYYVSDQEPVNNFEFLRPIVEELGYPYPKLKFPVWFMFYLAFFIEILHKWISPIFNFQPLTRAEIFKISVTHYFNPKNIQKDLNYYPIIR